MSYKTSNPSDLADSVTMRTARGGYCEERGSEDMEERERDKERPGSLQQPSVTPARPGTKSNLSLERNVQVCPREGLQKQGRAPGRSARGTAAAQSSPGRPAGRPRTSVTDGSRVFQDGSVLRFKRQLFPLHTLRRITVTSASVQRGKSGGVKLSTAASTSAADSTQEPGWR